MLFTPLFKAKRLKNSKKNAFFCEILRTFHRPSESISSKKGDKCGKWFGEHSQLDRRERGSMNSSKNIGDGSENIVILFGAALRRRMRAREMDKKVQLPRVMYLRWLKSWRYGWSFSTCGA